VSLTKYIVIACGLAGVAAFFMPLIHVNMKGYQGQVSAYDALKGIEVAEEGAKAGEVAGKLTGNRDLTQDSRDVKDKAETARALLVIPFVPPAVFLILGLFGFIKGSFGRIFGLGTLLFALIGLGLAALLYSAAQDEQVEDVLGNGFYLLALSYAGAAVCGLFSFLLPDR
jgi:hypothetical protein